MGYQLSEFGVTFSKDKLSNGVEVFLFNKIGAPVCTRAIFFAGARFDNISGTAHFLEHMLVAGTKKFPSKDKLAEPLEREGGSFSASTSLNYLRFNVSVPKKEDFELGLEILGEILFKASFADKIFENEKNSIISEIGESEEDPYHILGDIFSSIIFKNTPLEKSVIGKKDSVYKITKKDLFAFRDTFLNAGRMCVVVSGDITMEKCLSLLNKYIAGHKPEKSFDMPEIIPTNKDIKVESRPFKNNRQTYARMGFRTLGLNENDRENLSLELIANVLGMGRASRLIKELRYENGLVYSISARHLNHPDAGYLSVLTSFEENKLYEVIKKTIGELKKIKTDGISEKELEFAKSAMNKSVFNIMQTSWSWINFHEDEFMFNPKLARNITWPMNEIESLTLKEVNKTANKYLGGDNFYLALCGTDRKPEIFW